MSPASCRLLQAGSLAEGLVIRQQPRLEQFRGPDEPRIDGKVGVTAGFMNGEVQFPRLLQLVQNVEPAAAAFPLNWVARISQVLQFSKDKARHDQGPAEKPGGTEVGDPAINNNIGVDDEGLALSRFAREPHVRNDQRELVPVASHGEHHPKVTERAINDEARRPLDGVALVTENVGGQEQTGEEQTKQKA